MIETLSPFHVHVSGLGRTQWRVEGDWTDTASMCHLDMGVEGS